MPVIDPPRRFPAQILVPLSASQFATPQGNSRMRASVYVATLYLSVAVIPHTATRG